MSHNTRTNSCNFHQVSHPIGWRVLFHQVDTVTGICLGNTLPRPAAELVHEEVICIRWYVHWPITSNCTDHLCQLVSISYLGGSGFKFRSLHLRFGPWFVILFVPSREIRGQHFDYASIVSCRVLSHSFIRHPTLDAVAWDIQWTIKNANLYGALEKVGVNLYTGRFVMFSVITNIYNKKTKGPTSMELFTATGKLILLLSCCCCCCCCCCCWQLEMFDVCLVTRGET